MDRITRCLSDIGLSKSGLFPKGFIEETILTLHLLFPLYDKETVGYLEALEPHKPFPNIHDPVPQQLYLDDFGYWHDRLAALLAESQSPPIFLDSPWPTLRTLRLLWNDRRNPHQWWTFWFAATILLQTFIFGIITSVAACMQTHYARLQLVHSRTPYYA